MHSTVVCLVLDFINHTAHWAHAGDSRMYWFRDGRLRDRTRDHSLVQSLVDTGVLAPEEARTHPKRSELRSALGIAADVLEVTAGEGDATVEAGDVFMLCTDGVWEYLPDAVLERTLMAAPNPAAWIGELAVEVRRAASHKSSHDNFTVLTVWTRAAPTL